MPARSAESVGTAMWIFWNPIGCAKHVRLGQQSQIGFEFFGPSAYGFGLATTLAVNLSKSLIDLSDDERFSRHDI